MANEPQEPETGGCATRNDDGEEIVQLGLDSCGD